MEGRETVEHPSLSPGGHSSVGDDVGEAQVVVEVGRFEEGEGRVALAGGSQELRQVLAQVAAAVQEVGQGDDLERALGGEVVDGISDAGCVAVEIGLGGEGIAGLFVQPGGHASDRLVGVLEGSAMGHDQESSWRPVGGAQFRIDRLHTIEGDGGQLFVETETGATRMVSSGNWAATLTISPGRSCCT